MRLSWNVLIVSKSKALSFEHFELNNTHGNIGIISAKGLKPYHHSRVRNTSGWYPARQMMCCYPMHQLQNLI